LKIVRAAGLALLALIAVGVGAQQPPLGAASGSEAFRVLAREQSLAESYVVLMEAVGKEDVRHYAEGIRLYAGAKAEFDGLIEQMKQDIIQRVPFDDSEKFQAVLHTAVERRLAFTRHVDKIVETLPPGTRPGIADYLVGGAAELISAITDAGKAIWEAYWTVQEAEREDRETRRKETLAQLDALKWKPFHELAKSLG
jgi:hypothetical protein